MTVAGDLALVNARLTHIIAERDRLLFRVSELSEILNDTRVALVKIVEERNALERELDKVKRDRDRLVELIEHF